MYQPKITLNRDLLTDEQKNYGQWPELDPFALPEEKQEIYFRHRKAVMLFLDGEAIATITQETDVSKTSIYRLVKRCLQPHKDGRIYGFRALRSYLRIKIYRREKEVPNLPPSIKAGRSGAFQQLLERYPELRELIEELYLNLRRQDEAGKTVPFKRLTIKKIHKKFITLCRQMGLKGSDYPLNTKTKGYLSLCRYLKGLYDTETGKTVSARHGKDVAQKLGTGADDTFKRPSRPLEMVEFDAHKFDSIWAFEIPHPYLGTVLWVLSRFWLLAAKDRFSRAILGYCVCLKREYNQFDVLRCFKNAIKPWSPLKITLPGVDYHPFAGLPSGKIDRFSWAVWDLLTFDNALANLADRVRKVLLNNFGTDINPGPVLSKDHQPFIESFFNTLEECGFRDLPNTTGSNPRDMRRGEPETAAIRYQMTVSHLMQLIDVVIANYNATPHTSLGEATPLEVLEHYAANPDNYIRRLPEAKRNSLWMLNESVKRKVCGNISKGRRPYVQFESAKYSSQVLANSPSLIKQDLTLYFDPTDEDIRNVLAFLDNGEELGLLKARGQWSMSPHTLEMRKAVMKSKYRRQDFFLNYKDPIEGYRQYLVQKAEKSKVARNQYAAFQMNSEMLAPSPESSENMRDPEPDDVFDSPQDVDSDDLSLPTKGGFLIL